MRDIEFFCEDRVYRVRGLSRNLSTDSMRVNIRLSYADRYYIDTLDLYHARHRNAFCKVASLDVGIKPDIIKRDIGLLLSKLEQLQAKNINEILKSKKEKPTLSLAEQEEALLFLKNPTWSKSLPWILSVVDWWEKI